MRWAYNLHKKWPIHLIRAMSPEIDLTHGKQAFVLLSDQGRQKKTFFLTWDTLLQGDSEDESMDKSCSHVLKCGSLQKSVR